MSQTITVTTKEITYVAEKMPKKGKSRSRLDLKIDNDVDEKIKIIAKESYNGNVTECVEDVFRKLYNYRKESG